MVAMLADQSSDWAKADKAYESTFVLGVVTDTGDADGETDLTLPIRSWQARMTRTAISPRLATSTLRNTAVSSPHATRGCASPGTRSCPPSSPGS